MTYIVHGATGAQGSPVLASLLASGHPATAAVRTPANLPDGATAAAVDLTDAAALTALYTGASGVFVHLPLGAPEVAAAQAEAIATAIETARPARVVISTSGAIVDQPDSPLQAPEDAPVRRLIRRATESGVSTAIVSPRLYLENLLLPVVFGPAREAGVLRYPLPADFPVSWSSHLDVAEVVARLLTEDAEARTEGVIAIGHLPALTGEQLATEFGAALGHPVRYAALSPAEFGELITPLFGPGAAPVVSLYEALNAEPGFMISEPTSAQRVLDLAPRPVADWLAKMLA
ncbi:SDR family oxidoreductase [Leucobacter chromiireducens]|uniref:SDR family oxidoreductase n=1 Tax=Leucobacter chromiireducens TaxID=283877 RepID=UPI000F639D29|nr:NmrA family NAD(P)-binding protein [Leucobacter chromiireducens]